MEQHRSIPIYPGCVHALPALSCARAPALPRSPTAAAANTTFPIRPCARRSMFKAAALLRIARESQDFVSHSCRELHRGDAHAAGGARHQPHSGVRTKLLHNAATVSNANQTPETRGGKAVQKLCSEPVIVTASRCFSRGAWPLGRCRPPTLLAMGQNRQNTGKTCLLTPSARSGRMGPQ